MPLPLLLWFIFSRTTVIGRLLLIRTLGTPAAAWSRNDAGTEYSFGTTASSVSIFANGLTVAAVEGPCNLENGTAMEGPESMLTFHATAALLPEPKSLRPSVYGWWAQLSSEGLHTGASTRWKCIAASALVCPAVADAIGQTVCPGASSMRNWTEPDCRAKGCCFSSIPGKQGSNEGICSAPWAAPNFDDSAWPHAQAVTQPESNAGCPLSGHPNGIWSADGAPDIWCRGSISDVTVTDDPTPLSLIPQPASFMTLNGCQCADTWQVSDSTCSDGSTVYTGCSMQHPCDGDDDGVCGWSWCKIKDAASCELAAGENWDYCVPSIEMVTPPAAGTVDEEIALSTYIGPFTDTGFRRERGARCGLRSAVGWAVTTASCAQLCSSAAVACVSFEYSIGTGRCVLSSWSRVNSPWATISKPGSSVYYMPTTTSGSQCAAEGRCKPRSTVLGSTCTFPFVYKGTCHTNCTMVDSIVPWCATRTDSQGNYVSWDVCVPESCKETTTSSSTTTTSATASTTVTSTTDPCDGINCIAKSQCHAAGTCIAGSCTAPINTGDSCTDGIEDTVNDTCTTDGRCVGVLITTTTTISVMSTPHTTTLSSIATSTPSMPGCPVETNSMLLSTNYCGCNEASFLVGCYADDPSSVCSTEGNEGRGVWIPGSCDKCFCRPTSVTTTTDSYSTVNKLCAFMLQGQSLEWWRRQVAANNAAQGAGGAPIWWYLGLPGAWWHGMTSEQLFLYLEHACDEDTSTSSTVAVSATTDVTVTSTGTDTIDVDVDSGGSPDGTPNGHHKDHSPSSVKHTADHEQTELVDILLATTIVFAVAAVAAYACGRFHKGEDLSEVINMVDLNPPTNGSTRRRNSFKQIIVSKLRPRASSSRSGRCSSAVSELGCEAAATLAVADAVGKTDASMSLDDASVTPENGGKMSVWDVTAEARSRSASAHSLAASGTSLRSRSSSANDIDIANTLPASISPLRLRSASGHDIDISNSLSGDITPRQVRGTSGHNLEILTTTETLRDVLQGLESISNTDLNSPGGGSPITRSRSASGSSCVFDGSGNSSTLRDLLNSPDLRVKLAGQEQKCAESNDYGYLEVSGEFTEMKEESRMEMESSQDRALRSEIVRTGICPSSSQDPGTSTSAARHWQTIRTVVRGGSVSNLTYENPAVSSMPVARGAKKFSMRLGSSDNASAASPSRTPRTLLSTPTSGRGAALWRKVRTAVWARRVVQRGRNGSRACSPELSPPNTVPSCVVSDGPLAKRLISGRSDGADMDTHADATAGAFRQSSMRASPVFQGSDCKGSSFSTLLQRVTVAVQEEETAAAAVGVTTPVGEKRRGSGDSVNSTLRDVLEDHGELAQLEEIRPLKRFERRLSLEPLSGILPVGVLQHDDLAGQEWVEWSHGLITMKDAESRLQAAAMPEGGFCLAETGMDTYVLSVVVDQSVKHFDFYRNSETPMFKLAADGTDIGLDTVNAIRTILHRLDIYTTLPVYPGPNDVNLVPQKAT